MTDRTFAAVAGAFALWRSQMDTPQAKPCRDCGTPTGPLRSNLYQPWRARGLCSPCYVRHYNNGTHRQFTPTMHEPGGQAAPPSPVPPFVALTRPPAPEPWGAPHTTEWQATVAWERLPASVRWASYGPVTDKRRMA